MGNASVRFNTLNFDYVIEGDTKKKLHHQYVNNWAAFLEIYIKKIINATG